MHYQLIILLFALVCQSFLAAGASRPDQVGFLVERHSVLHQEGALLNAKHYKTVANVSMNDVRAMSSNSYWEFVTKATAGVGRPSMSIMAVKAPEAGYFETSGSLAELPHYGSSTLYTSAEDIYIFSSSVIDLSPKGNTARENLFLSAAKLPYGHTGVMEFHLGAMDRDFFDGDVTSLGTDAGAEIRISRSHEVTSVDVDRLNRPVRMVTTKADQSPVVVTQWSYDGESKWPVMCAVISSRGLGQVDIEKIELGEVTTFEGSVAKKIPVGQIVALTDFRKSVETPILLKSPGSSPLTVADVLGAADAALAAEKTKVVVAPSGAGSVLPWLMVVFGVVAAGMVVLFLRSRKKSQSR